MMNRNRLSLIICTVTLMIIASAGMVTAQSNIHQIKKQIEDLKKEYQKKSDAARRDKNTDVNVNPWNPKTDQQIKQKAEFDKWKREVYDPKLAKLQSALDSAKNNLKANYDRANSQNDQEHSRCTKNCKSDEACMRRCINEYGARGKAIEQKYKDIYSY